MFVLVSSVIPVGFICVISYILVGCWFPYAFSVVAVCCFLEFSQFVCVVVAFFIGTVGALTLNVVVSGARGAAISCI